METETLLICIQSGGRLLKPKSSLANHLLSSDNAMLVKIPGGVSLTAAASISDNASDGFRTVGGPLANRPGAEVLIVGGLAQSVGLFAVQAAIAHKAGKVVYMDYSSERLQLAHKLGAEAQRVEYNSIKKLDQQFPIVVDASNSR